jgi:ribosomal protein S18 acetylase RimI-like enzyme
MIVQVRALRTDEGMLWKDLRLKALAESPDAFATTLESQRHHPDSEWLEMIATTAASEIAESLVAELAGQPAGIARCRLAAEDRTTGHIHSMWVDPQFRRRGVGGALLTFALSWLEQRGALSAELGVNERNDAAAALYRASGFAFTGATEPLREGSSQRIAVMKSALSPVAM